MVYFNLMWVGKQAGREVCVWETLGKKPTNLGGTSGERNGERGEKWGEKAWDKKHHGKTPAKLKNPSK